MPTPNSALSVRPASSSWRRCVTISSVTFGLLTTEILLSSIFHVLLGEGNTVAAIAIALLGLSSSGVVSYLIPRYAPGDHTWSQAHTLLWWFGLSVMATPYLIMSVPLNYADLVFAPTEFGRPLLRFVVYGIAAVPFFLGGMVINLLFRRYVPEISRLYFADLGGAAIGCAVSPFLLATVGAPRGILYSAIPALLVAAPSLRQRALRSQLLLVLPVAVLIMADLVTPGMLSFRVLNTMGRVDEPRFRRFPVHPGDIEFEKWALDAWTIIRSSRIPQQWEDFRGWGVSPHYDGPVPRIKQINYNARFSTYVTEYDGDIGKLGPWLDADLISLHYLLGRRFDNVLIIGAGGGREVLNALHHDARNVTAVDVSDVVINDLMKGKLREFSGGLFLDPRVTALAAEGRSFAERSRGQFDLIDFSIVGGANLEKMDLVRVDDLFTVEALRTYLSRLHNNGVFSYVMYTLRSDLVDQLAGRESLVTPPYVPALKTLTGLRMVIEDENPHTSFRDHVLIAGLPGVVAANFDLVHIVVSKTPFSEEERSKFVQLCRRLGFVLFYPPAAAGAERSGLYGDIVEAPTLSGLAGILPFSIWPATDDIPFHHALDWRHLRRALADGNLLSFLAGNPLFALAASVTLFAFIVVVLPLLWSAVQGHRLPNLEGSWPLLLLFACLGYGYMAVEIAALLKLQIYLGKPVYGLSVGLFAFLLSSGLGSNWTNRLNAADPHRYAYQLVGVLIVTGVGFSALSNPVFAATFSLPLPFRILIAVASIAPLAFFMGTFFPLGMILLAERDQDLVPWAWAINGSLSVVGIFATRIVALFLGFNRALLIGLFVYLLAMACFWANRKLHSGSRRRKEAAARS